MLLIIGVLIAVGAALAFIIIGVLTLLGAADATQHQVVPGFRPDQSGPTERVLTLLGVWGPILLLVTLCLLGGLQILRVAFTAL